MVLLLVIILSEGVFCCCWFDLFTYFITIFFFGQINWRYVPFSFTQKRNSVWKRRFHKNLVNEQNTQKTVLELNFVSAQLDLQMITNEFLSHNNRVKLNQTH